MYIEGHSVKPDDKLGFEWHLKAANQGLSQAQFNVGVMYYKGKGTQQDIEKARMWLQKAADQGDDLAKKALESINK